MKSIRRFSAFIFIFSIILFLTLFSFNANKHLNDSAQLIIDNARKELAMLSYTISTQTNSYEDIKGFRALLDRTKASTSIIQAIYITDKERVLVSTDHTFSTLPQSDKYNIPDSMSALEMISEKKILHDEVAFYITHQRHEVNLYIVLNFKKIYHFIHKGMIDFIYHIIPISVIYFITLGYLFSRLVMNPLEKLRLYAYNNTKAPKKFFFSELDSIRLSMTQTFQNLKEEKLELHKLARTDPLSGLANRAYLYEQLKWLVGNSDRQNKEFALLFLDLDHFKTINDSIGHQVGDKLLKEIALKITETTRANDIIARVGGDEFVIIINNYDSIFELTQAIDRIQTKLSQPFVIENHTLELTNSIGIAFYPKDGIDAVSLMKNADIAMYHAKNNGRNQYSFFTKELNNKIQEDILLSKEMKEALKNNEFELYYQPKVRILDNIIIGSEALIRWHHPTRGLIAPDLFIPLAEKNGFIIELGEWITKEAMNQQVSWRDRNICDIPVSINVSIKQLFHKDFEKSLLTTIKESGISTDKVDIEIVESMFLKNTSTSLYILNMLKKNGLTISLDDFGTGYSSLSYLKKFPIHTLKIDKVFIDDYNSKSGAIFLDTIIKMGQTLQMQVLCEGVENEEQRKYLEELNCDSYQGYLCAKPLTAKDFENLIAKKSLLLPTYPL